MNYIGCFNRSWDGLQVCSPFFFVLVPRCCQVWSVAAGAPLRRSWCLDAARRGVLQPVHLCAVPGASMLPGVECCPRALCARPWCLDVSRRGVLSVAPFCAVPGAPQCCQVWSVTRAPFAPFLVPRCCQVWSVARCTFCARPGAFLVPTLLRYTYYSISQILELFVADPTPGSSL